jgi:hypothetical protein
MGYTEVGHQVASSFRVLYKQSSGFDSNPNSVCDSIDTHSMDTPAYTLTHLIVFQLVYAPKCVVLDSFRSKIWKSIDWYAYNQKE